jgi:hypothetical protein
MQDHDAIMIRDRKWPQHGRIDTLKTAAVAPMPLGA